MANAIDITTLNISERDVARLLLLQPVPSLAGVRITVADAARMFNLTRQRLWQLGKEFRLPIADEDGTYDVVEVIQAYLRYVYEKDGAPKLSLVEIAEMEARAEQAAREQVTAGTDPTAPER